MNKKISTGFAVLMIIIISVFFITILKIGESSWKEVEVDNYTIPQSKVDNGKVCTMEAKICPDGSSVGRNSENNCEFFPCSENNNANTIVGNDRDEHGCIGSAGYSWCEEKQKCLRRWEESCASKNKVSINWNNIQFDSCGKREKYQNLSWWNDFSQRISAINLYSDSYIWSQMQRNDYYGKYDNYEEYCQNPNYKNMDVCVDGEKKLSIDNFDEYSEGCLSKDNSVFIAVFAGSYMGGDNHVFRYDIKNNILEEAKRSNEKRGESWFAPPTEFQKRNGNFIRMHGMSGDAGIGVETWYNYNFITNEIKIIKSCTTSDNSAGQPETECQIIS